MDTLRKAVRACSRLGELEPPPLNTIYPGRNSAKRYHTYRGDQAPKDQSFRSGLESKTSSLMEQEVHARRWNPWCEIRHSWPRPSNCRNIPTWLTQNGTAAKTRSAPRGGGG